MNWPDEKIKIIAEAFDEEKIYGGNGTLSGTVTNTSGNPVSEANVSASLNGVEIESTTTDTNGKYSLELPGVKTYSISITADGYAEFTTTQAIDEGEEFTLNAVITPTGTGSLSGKITDMNESPIAGVTLSLRAGHISEARNSETTDALETATSDTNGEYSFSNLAYGSYNITTSKDGYASQTVNVTVDENANHENIILSNNYGTDSGEWNVYLWWGDNISDDDEPYDLDAHVIVWKADGSSVETYYANKINYVNDSVISLDRDVIRNGTNKTGPERMIFTPTASITVDYFVHWYRGSGTWASSKAKVMIVSPAGTSNIYDVPSDTTAYSTNYSRDTCWHVLRIKNGLPTIVNEILTTNSPQNPDSSSSSGNVSLAGFDTGTNRYYPSK